MEYLEPTFTYFSKIENREMRRRLNCRYCGYLKDEYQSFSMAYATTRPPRTSNQRQSRLREYSPGL